LFASHKVGIVFNHMLCGVLKLNSFSFIGVGVTLELRLGPCGPPIVGGGLLASHRLGLVCVDALGWEWVWGVR